MDRNNHQDDAVAQHVQKLPPTHNNQRNERGNVENLMGKN
jgi:hypothetical protein